MEKGMLIEVIYNEEGDSANLTPITDILELNIQFYNMGKNVGNKDDPDDSDIVKNIYKTIFPFYDETYCRGETLNTYNSTFGKDNNRKLLEIFEKENINEEDKDKLLKKVMEFKKICHAIGNFTVLDRGRLESKSINTSRGTNSLRDSWPLTLLCIQDFFNGYSDKTNPLKNVFETHEETIEYFKHYKNIKDGFERFCDDQYLSPKYYNDEFQYAYVEELQNGKYKVKLDLFNGLSFMKPVANNIIEMEQYIERTTNKIIKRGEILLKEYLKKSEIL